MFNGQSSIFNLQWFYSLPYKPYDCSHEDGTDNAVREYTESKINGAYLRQRLHLLLHFLYVHTGLHYRLTHLWRGEALLKETYERSVVKEVKVYVCRSCHDYGAISHRECHESKSPTERNASLKDFVAKMLQPVICQERRCNTSRNESKLQRWVLHAIYKACKCHYPQYAKEYTILAGVCFQLYVVCRGYHLSLNIEY